MSPQPLQGTVAFKMKGSGRGRGSPAEGTRKNSRTWDLPPTNPSSNLFRVDSEQHTTSPVMAPHGHSRHFPSRDSRNTHDEESYARPERTRFPQEPYTRSRSPPRRERSRSPPKRSSNDKGPERPRSRSPAYRRPRSPAFGIDRSRSPSRAQNPNSRRTSSEFNNLPPRADVFRPNYSSLPPLQLSQQGIDKNPADAKASSASRPLNTQPEKPLMDLTHIPLGPRGDRVNRNSSQALSPTHPFAIPSSQPVYPPHPKQSAVLDSVREPAKDPPEQTAPSAPSKSSVCALSRESSSIPTPKETTMPLQSMTSSLSSPASYTEMEVDAIPVMESSTMSTSGLSSTGTILSSKHQQAAKTGRALSAEELGIEFGGFFNQLLTESLDTLSLRQEQVVANKAVLRCKQDVEKCKESYEGNPAFQHKQTKKLSAASNNLDIVEKQLKQKEDALELLAVKNLSRLVPSIVNVGGTFQSRNTNLDKTCHNLKKRIEDQQKQLREQEIFIKDFVEKQKSFQDKIEKELMDTKAKVSGVKLPSDLTSKVEALTKRVDSFNGLKLDMSKIKEEAGRHTKSFNDHVSLAGTYHEKITSIDSALQGSRTSISLPARVTRLENIQVNIQSTLQDLEGTETAMQNLGEKLTRNENDSQEKAKDLDIKLSQFDSRLKLVENRPGGSNTTTKNSAKANPLDKSIPPADSAFATLQIRVQSLEAKMKDTSMREERSVTANAFDALTKDLRSAHDSWVAQESRLNDEKINSGLAVIETETAAKSEALSETLSSRLSHVQENIALLEKRIKTLSGMKSFDAEEAVHLINDHVRNSLIPIQKRLDAFESTSQGVMHTLSDAEFERLRSSILDVVDKSQAGVDDLFGGMMKQLWDKIETLEAEPASTLSTTPQATIAIEPPQAQLAMTEELTSFKFEIEKVQNRLNKLDASLATVPDAESMNIRLDKLEASPGVKLDVEHMQNRLVKLENSSSDKVTFMEAFQRSSNSQALDQRRMENDLTTLKDQLSYTQSLHAMATTKVQEAVNSANQANTMGAKLGARIDTLFTRQNESDAHVAGRLEGIEFMINSLDTRFHNINTKDMAQFILGQMDLTYPKIREADDAVALLKDGAVQLQIIGRDLGALQSKILSLESQNSQNHAPGDNVAIAAIEEDISTVKTKIVELEELTKSQLTDAKSQPNVSALYDEVIERLKTKLEALSEEMAEVDITAKDANAKAEAATNMIHTSEADIAALKSAHINFEAIKVDDAHELSEQGAEISDLKAQLKELKAELVAQIDDYKGQFGELKARLTPRPVGRPRNSTPHGTPGPGHPPAASQEMTRLSQQQNESNRKRKVNGSAPGSSSKPNTNGKSSNYKKRKIKAASEEGDVDEDSLETSPVLPTVRFVISGDEDEEDI